MAIITISRGSYSKGKEIAESLARRLGYECISRDILIEASEHFNVPEVKLIRALHDSPSFLDRFSHGKEKYVAFIREAFLEHIRNDNIVYHGLAGHFFIRDVQNVLKCRIIARIEDRVREEIDREHISEEKARYILRKDDEERRKWGMALYGIDTWDPSLYDMVLHIDSLKVSDAVDILADAAQRPCFQLTDTSRKTLKDLLLAAKAHAVLIDSFPTARVTCKDSVVFVSVNAPMLHERDATLQVKNLIGKFEKIRDIRVNIMPLYFQD